MEEEQPVEIEQEVTHKRVRHRKRQLYTDIRAQMEFYFSDSNLSKDRFLGQLILDDPYVNLVVFQKFNRIRNLTTNINDLCKGIRTSEILELSEDNTKVRRKTKVQVKQNQDECTIYVERLPVDAEHDWLKTIFSKFGAVDYVSIPKYKNNNKMIKGFAFIEFSTPEAAQQVLQYFESIGCKLPTTMLPEKLASISTFEEPSLLKNKTITKITEDVKIEAEDLSIKNEIKIKKKKVRIQDDVVEDTKPKKRTAEENDETETEIKKMKVEKIEEIQQSEISEMESDKIEEDGDTEVNIEKKKRKRKKARKNHVDFQQIGLQVLSKKEWKQLRNKYLNLQKQKMKKLKEQFHRNRFVNTVFTPVENTPEADQESPRFQFTPGAIVNIELNDIVPDVKKFKSEIRLHPGIEYIDIKPNCSRGFIRFKDNECATKFTESFKAVLMEILDGDLEQEYWNKMVETKNEQTKKKIKKQRGRDKLLKKAEKELGKHIKFDD